MKSSRMDAGSLESIPARPITDPHTPHAIRTTARRELDRIFDEIASMEKKELEGTLVTRYDDRFQWPLLLALILIVGEFFVSERKKPLKGTVNE